jgi:hypothetical protein
MYGELVLVEALQRLDRLARVVKPGGLIRLLEYVRPRGRLRRVIARFWEPWIAWAYGASFDRETERHVPESGLELVESLHLQARASAGHRPSRFRRSRLAARTLSSRMPSCRNTALIPSSTRFICAVRAIPSASPKALSRRFASSSRAGSMSATSRVFQKIHLRSFGSPNQRPRSTRRMSGCCRIARR